jgi:hypothetical protein
MIPVLKIKKSRQTSQKLMEVASATLQGLNGLQHKPIFLESVKASRLSAYVFCLKNMLGVGTEMYRCISEKWLLKLVIKTVFNELLTEQRVHV